MLIRFRFVSLHYSVRSMCEYAIIPSFLHQFDVEDGQHWDEEEDNDDERVTKILFLHVPSEKKKRFSFVFIYFYRKGREEEFYYSL